MPQPQSTGPSHFQRVIVIPAYLDVIDTAGGKRSYIHWGLLVHYPLEAAIEFV